MKIGSFIILFFLSILSLFSQEEKKMVYELKYGVNLARNFSFIDDYSIGYQIGVLAEISITTNQFITPEILYYSLKSNRKVFKDDFGNETEIIKINEKHVFFNLLYKYSFKNKFNISVGPSFDYFIKGNSIYSINVRYYNKVLFGIVGGFGYNISKKLEIELHYNSSFRRSDFRKFSLNQNILMLSINYSFN